MIRRASMLLALAVAIPATAQETAAGQAQTYATGLQSFVGMKILGKTKLSAIHAEGDAVVFTVDGRLWPSDPYKATNSWVEGLCGSAPNFFVNGVILRMRFTEKGKETVDGHDVDRCPPPKN